MIRTNSTPQRIQITVKKELCIINKENNSSNLTCILVFIMCCQFFGIDTHFSLSKLIIQDFIMKDGLIGITTELNSVSAGGGWINEPLK